MTTTDDKTWRNSDVFSFFPAAAAADSKLVSDEHVKDFIHTLIPVDLFSKTNSANLAFEKSQRHPSYIMPKKQKGLGKPH